MLCSLAVLCWCHETPHRPHRRQMQVLGIGKICLVRCILLISIKKRNRLWFSCILLLLLLIQSKISLYFGPVQPVWCFVTPVLCSYWNYKLDLTWHFLISLSIVSSDFLWDGHHEEAVQTEPVVEAIRRCSYDVTSLSELSLCDHVLYFMAALRWISTWWHCATITCRQRLWKPLSSLIWWQYVTHAAEPYKRIELHMAL